MTMSRVKCAGCGLAISIDELDDHVCAADLAASQASRPCAQIDRLDEELARYLETPHGRFECWYAERMRPGLVSAS
jgi:hypothetical protein